jgi:enolase
MGANAIPGRIPCGSQRCGKCLGLPLFQYIGGVNGKTLPVPDDEYPSMAASTPTTTLTFRIHGLDAVGARTQEVLRMGAEVFHSLKAVLKG